MSTIYGICMGRSPKQTYMKRATASAQNGLRNAQLVMGASTSVCTYTHTRSFGRFTLHRVLSSGKEPKFRNPGAWQGFHFLP